jgi:hypothetical protein
MSNATDDAFEQLCIVMVLCEGGDLATVIEKRRMHFFTESEVRRSQRFVLSISQKLFGHIILNVLKQSSGYQLVDPDWACTPVHAR